MKQKAKTSPGRAAVFLLLLLGAFTMVVPFVWMLSTSLKEAKLVYEIPPRWIPDPVDWHNYVEVWTKSNLVTGIKNSVIVSAGVLFFGTIS